MFQWNCYRTKKIRSTFNFLLLVLHSKIKKLSLFEHILVFIFFAYWKVKYICVICMLAEVLTRCIEYAIFVKNSFLFVLIFRYIFLRILEILHENRYLIFATCVFIWNFSTYSRIWYYLRRQQVEWLLLELH